jgi:hypothetical protein
MMCGYIPTDPSTCHRHGYRRQKPLPTCVFTTFYHAVTKVENEKYRKWWQSIGMTPAVTMTPYTPTDIPPSAILPMEKNFHVKFPTFDPHNSELKLFGGGKLRNTCLTHQKTPQRVFKKWKKKFFFLGPGTVPGGQKIIWHSQRSQIYIYISL